jgi:signal peptidase
MPAVVTATVRPLGRLLGSAFVVASLCLVAFIGVGPRVLPYRTETLLSGSMRPGMPEGSVVVVTRKAATRVRVGDVLAYQIPVKNRRVVTHRVVKVLVAGPHPVIQTQGDANNTPDPWIARLEESTVWQARFAVPRLGRVIQVLRGDVVHALAVAVAPLLLLSFLLLEIWRPPAAAAEPG